MRILIAILFCVVLVTSCGGGGGSTAPAASGHSWYIPAPTVSNGASIGANCQRGCFTCHQPVVGAPNETLYGSQFCPAMYSTGGFVPCTDCHITNLFTN